MKSRFSLAVVVAATLLSALAGQAGAQAPKAKELNIGDPAPALSVGKWFKGAPIAGFEKGKVYVVEFWATWCGPCRATIPHLTELAKKFDGKVTFAGISVWEDATEGRAAVETTVAKFIEGMGNKMDYHVGLDTEKNEMSQNWMRAAGERGIPAAFVVNQEGKIAWIGHPMDNMDEVLDKVVNKAFDVQKAKAQRDQQRAETAKLEEAYKTIQAALEKEDFPGAVAEIDKALAKYPEFAGQMEEMKLMCLLQYDQKAAAKFATDVAGRKDAEPNALNSMAWEMLSIESPEPEILKAALAISKVAAEKSEPGVGQAMAIDTYALALFKNGNKAEAIAQQKKAIEIASKLAELPEGMMEEMKERLAEFEKS